VGPDLAYWARAIRFAASLVVRQRHLPGLTGGKDTWRAVWHPVIGGDDILTFRRLAAGMPPAARALTKPGTPSPSSPVSGAGGCPGTVVTGSPGRSANADQLPSRAQAPLYGAHPAGGTYDRRR
jgi:hypothetical protein